MDDFKYEGPENFHLGVLIPHTGTVEAKTALSLAQMSSHFAAWKPKNPRTFGMRSKRMSFFMLAGSMLPQSRQDLTAKALQAGCTHLLWLDSDMVFPRDTWLRLVMRNKAFIGCNCTSRTWPVLTIAHDLKGRPIDSSRCSGVEEVQHIGLAVAMVRADLVKKLRPPMYMMEWVPEFKRHSGEDVYFSMLVQEAGEKVWVDHDLSPEITHIGRTEFGYAHLGLNEAVVEHLELPDRVKRMREDEVPDERVA